MFGSKEDIFELFELIDKFDKSTLCKLDVSFLSPENAGIKIKMAKSQNGEAPFFKREEEDRSGKTITAPLVGTFYTSPSPDSEPYVKIGDKIKSGTVVCIIEAMKTMNEIESETDGEITGILAENGSPVEYGQPLFRVG
jgi:acetyl-CoA carboxylase biotin carboxyl carrier protein